MSRSWTVVAASALLAACGSVSDKTPDAKPATDGKTTTDGASTDSAVTAPSIIAVHHVIDMQRADQSLSGTFTSGAGKALVIAAGSGQCASGIQIGMTIKVDGTPIGTSRSATNELNSSKAFVRNAIPVDLTAGMHTITLVPLAGTTMGVNEYADATVVELGGGAAPKLVMNDASPPYVTNLTVTPGKGVMLVGVSGFTSASAAATLSADFKLDSQSKSVLKTYTNEGVSHKTFGADHIVLDLASGTHAVDLSAISGTSIDQNDRASALWLGLGSDVTLTKVIDQTIGALPVMNTFTSSGRQVMFFLSGSGFANPAGVIEVALQLDSVTLGSMKVTTTEISSHKQMVPTVLLAQPAAGTHTVKLTAATGTTTDFNDRFNVTAVELGP